jgi:hypothetical protein
VSVTVSATRNKKEAVREKEAFTICLSSFGPTPALYWPRIII